MDIRLIAAYDAMEMPEDCADRIEGVLSRELRKQRPGQYIQVMPRQSSPWFGGAALVCVVLVICAWLLHSGGVKPELTAATQATEAFQLTEAGEDFLRQLCSAMGDWEGPGDLDDRFWSTFLFHSFSRPSRVDNGIALTVGGEVPWEDGWVWVSRETAEAYVALAMGMELPRFSVAGPESGEELRWENEGYRIFVQQNVAMGYVLRSVEAGTVTFDSYVIEPSNRKGSVTFSIAPAENENGFIITGKRSFGEPLSEGLDIRTLIDRGAEAYFAGDPEALQKLMTENQRPVPLYAGDPAQVTIVDQRILSPDALETFDGGRVADVTFRTPEGLWILRMELEDVGNGALIRYLSLTKGE